MSPLLWRASWRYGLRHPAQLGLSLFGIALGVAVVVAIDLTVDSARRAFSLSNEAVLGRATHQIVGGPGGVAEASFVELREKLPRISAAPVIEAHARTLGEHPETLTLLGVDPFSEAPFRGAVTGVGAGVSAGASAGAPSILAALLTRPGAAVLGAGAGARLALEAGQSLTLSVGGREETVEIVALVTPEDRLARASADDLLILDIASGQELAGRPGFISRIDLIVPDDGASLARVRALVPDGARLVEAGARTRNAAEMTAAFHLNLSMLSLLALVVGLFLVYNTMAFSVVQRWRLLGDLRTVGVTRAEIARLVLVEAALLGSVAAALGLALGVALADQLLGLVARTINDLYFAVNVRAVHLAPWTLAKGAFLGSIASVAAAAVPALEASRAPPGVARLRSSAESLAASRVGVLAVCGVLLLALAALALALPGQDVRGGYAALFAVVVGAALLAPAATAWTVRASEPLLARGPGRLGALAVRGVSASLSRTSVAIAALMVALSAVVGVGVMVDSFRASVARWLDVTLRADLYVGAPGTGTGRVLAPDLVAAVRALPEVTHASSGRMLGVQSSRGELRLLVLSMAPLSYDGFDLVVGEPAAAWRAFDADDAVLVSEPFAWRHAVGPGDFLDLETGAGSSAFRVVGVYRDYESERGGVLMSRPTFDRHWSDPGVATLGLYLAQGAAPAAVAARVETIFSARQAVVVRANGEIKAASMAIFERTFTITGLLQALAMLVALVGVISALMAIELERARELAVLRAQGLTRGGLWMLIETQTAVMGLLAGVLALPLGLALAVILVHVINRRSFGWSMSLEIDPALLGQTVAVALVAALLAGLYPAWRMATTAPALALREE